MASLFSKPKTPSMPAVAAPPPPPAVADTKVDTFDASLKAAKRRSNFRKTILTGDLEPNTGKKQLLG